VDGVVFVAPADDQIAEYQITAAPNASVPEPRLLWATGLGLLILLLAASVRRSGLAGRARARLIVNRFPPGL